MLTQANHWLEILGCALDVILLARVLLLRLNRIYLFITLGLVLTVIFDGVSLWLDPEPKPSALVFIYSRFLYAFVFPLIAWEVFEEIKPKVAKLRRLAMTRLISGLLFACLFGLMISLLADFSDSGDSGENAVVSTVGLIFWAASSTATLAFLWTIHRQLRSQKVELPNNTHVWIVFWELSLLAEVLSCVWALVAAFVKGGTDYITLAFELYSIALTAWCIVKLRAIPAGVPSESANSSV